MFARTRKPFGAWVTGLLALAAAAAGCKGRETPAGGGTGTGGSSKGSASAHASPAGAGKLTKSKAVTKKATALAPASYRKLIVALESCKIGAGGRINRDCDAYRALDLARRRSGSSLRDFVGMGHKLGIELLAHKSASVRLFAAGLLRSFFGSNKASRAAVLSRREKETNPHVVAKMIYAVGSSASSDETVATWLRRSADHKHEAVRKRAIYYLAYQKVKGALAKVVQTLESDPSPKVREVACRYAYHLGDDRVLTAMAKHVENPAGNPSLYRECMYGLFDMWNAFLGNSKPSKKAYELTMKRLTTKPYSQTHPPFGLMSRFGRGPRGAPKWFQRRAVVKMLAAVVTDDGANWLARTGAVGALEKLKAVKVLKTLRRRLGATKRAGSADVLKRVQTSLANLLS